MKSNISGFSYLGYYSGSNYYISNNIESWTNADSICSSLGGNLVVFSDVNENIFVDSMAFIYSGDASFIYNIGLYQDTSSLFYSEPSGGWKWVTNETLSFLNWQINEPNEATPGENFGSNAIIKELN